ncbi:hypothetical protein LCGC14_1562790 [marine sediment metagenome]|uniref:DOD-type homing endonuclease domain-containing protein n=1 Tax=marine sediment metagenome TaxID=412755 RepID=A0A0F9IM05_9ZZZZ
MKKQKKECKMVYITPKALFLKNKFNESFNSYKKEWALLLGHLYGDGGFSCKRVYYCNTHANLLNEFENTFNFLFENFGLNLKRREFTLVCNSTYLLFYLKKININYILKEDKNSKINFIRALFNDEGSVSKDGIISIIMKNNNIIILLYTLLKDLGINRIKKYKIFNKKYQRQYHCFRLSKQENKKFLETIGFVHNHKLERANKYTNIIKGHYEPYTKIKLDGGGKSTFRVTIIDVRGKKPKEKGIIISSGKKYSLKEFADKLKQKIKEV